MNAKLLSIPIFLALAAIGASAAEPSSSATWLQCSVASLDKITKHYGYSEAKGLAKSVIIIDGRRVVEYGEDDGLILDISELTAWYEDHIVITHEFDNTRTKAFIGRTTLSYKFMWNERARSNWAYTSGPYFEGKGNCTKIEPMKLPESDKKKF